MRLILFLRRINRIITSTMIQTGEKTSSQINMLSSTFPKAINPFSARVNTPDTSQLLSPIGLDLFRVASISDVSEVLSRYCIRPVSYTHLTLPTNREV